MDQIRKPLAPTDRGLRDEGFRVRGRVGPALRRVRTAPIRRRILGPVGRRDLVARVMEERSRTHCGVLDGPHTRAASRHDYGGYRTSSQGFPREIETRREGRNPDGETR